jgi:hypothetical protein
MPSLKNSSGHPAICSEVVRAPLTAPIPVFLLSPINARNSPIPQAAAILRDTGMIFTSPDNGVNLCVHEASKSLTLAHAYQRQEYEHKSFDENCCES